MLENILESGFPEEFTVHLTGDDIATGIAGECQLCPYAIAVTRALERYLSIGQWIEIDSDFVTVNKWIEPMYSISEKLVEETIVEYIPDFGLGNLYQDFIGSFDDDGVDHPAVFPHQMRFISEDEY